jgi:hypothetical protein
VTAGQAAAIGEALSLVRLALRKAKLVPERQESSSDRAQGERLEGDQGQAGGEAGDGVSAGKAVAGLVA